MLIHLRMRSAESAALMCTSGQWRQSSRADAQLGRSRQTATPFPAPRCLQTVTTKCVKQARSASRSSCSAPIAHLRVFVIQQPSFDDCRHRNCGGLWPVLQSWLGSDVSRRLFERLTRRREGRRCFRPWLLRLAVFAASREAGRAFSNSFPAG